MTFAVVPAAGLSTRMGQPKLGLPLGDSSVLERVVSALRDGGVEVVLVVAGPHMPALTALAESAGATVLCLSAPTADMRETVQAGLRWLDERYHPRDEDVWLLSPGDCPAFAATTVRRLLAIATGELHCPILVPTIGGRRGHPTAFSWRYVPDILRLPPGAGIDSFVRTQSVREVPCDDAGILCDLNTPADYDRLRESQQQYSK